MTHQELIKNCKTLQDLCDILNSLDEDTELIEDYQNLDTSALPIFGGNEPSDTSVIISWNEDGFLIPDSERGKGWCIEKRCKHGEAWWLCSHECDPTDVIYR